MLNQRNDENINNNNVDVDMTKRRSARERKSVQQCNLGPVKSPRSMKKAAAQIIAAAETENAKDSTPATPLKQEYSEMYIELDPFAPPPRLSLGMQSPTPATPSFSKVNNLTNENQDSNTNISTPKSKSQKGQQQQPPKQPESNYTGNILFEQLSSAGIAIKAVIDSWLELCESGREKKEIPCLLLINLVLWAAHVEIDIKPENLITESATQVLDDLQDRIEPASSKAEFPLLDAKKKNKTFRNQYSGFWVMWAESVLPSIKDMELIEKVIMPWLISMTSAGYRAIRYAATIAVLDIVQGCCRACVSMQKELETVGRVMSTKRGMASKKSAEAISSRMADIEKLMQLSIDAVFIQRYRDVDHLMRERCVDRIHSWICTYPEVFLDNAYLRYIGWSLSDKVPAVRLASLSAWKAICSRSEFRPALTDFILRFKARLFEVLTRDVDKSCRKEAGGVVDILFASSFLESSEISAFLDDLIFSGDETISTLLECTAQRIFLKKSQDLKVALSPLDVKQCIRQFANFIMPYMNSETSVEANNFILKQIINNLRGCFPDILTNLSASSALLKELISSEAQSGEEAEQKSELISTLLAVQFAQVQNQKSSNQKKWDLDNSIELFNFINDLIKFINDNEGEIFSKDIFYLFSLINEVIGSSSNSNSGSIKSHNLIDIAPLTTWESLLPIFMELFCSIDDLESAKVAFIFFNRIKCDPLLKDKMMNCVEVGSRRLCQDLIRQIPGNMREALKIKDLNSSNSSNSSILTLVLPLSQMNLLTSLPLDDSVLISILGMTKLIDEFVVISPQIDQTYKTMIWTCSVRLVFHELMWKMMEARRQQSNENDDFILELKEKLVDLLAPSEYLLQSQDNDDGKEGSYTLDLDSFERISTCLNVLSDLALLFSSSSTNRVVIDENDQLALKTFLKLITKVVSDPLPERESESFELSRAVKKSYSNLIASTSKLFSLHALPAINASILFETFGYGDEVSDSIIKVVFKKLISQETMIPIMNQTLQGGYLMALMSSDYERFMKTSLIPLTKMFNEQLGVFSTTGSTTMNTNTGDIFQSAIEFYSQNPAQRSEFLGKIMTQFTWNLSGRQSESILSLIKGMKGVNLNDSFVKSFIRSVERMRSSSIAQKLLKRTSSLSSSGSGSSSGIASNLNTPLGKVAKLESVNEKDEDDMTDLIDQICEIDSNTQMLNGNNEKDILDNDNDDYDAHINNQNKFDHLPFSPPAILKRKVTRY